MDEKIMIPAKGWFMNDIIVWNELDCRGFAAKGFEIEVADYRISANDEKNNFHSKINSLLRLTYQSPVEIHTQVQWSVDSEYRKMLTEYDNDTEALAKNKWTYNVRKERYNRYTEMMEQKKLRREKCSIYVSFKLTNKVPPNLSRVELIKYYEGVMGNAKQIFSNYEQKLKNVLGSNNVQITPMGDREHFLHMYEYSNPGISNGTGAGS